MTMTHIVYVKFSQITELTHKDVLLKDVAHPSTMPARYTAKKPLPPR